MWITHSYLGTTMRGTRCLFFLLFEDYIEAQATYSKEVQGELERFARNMGNFGALVAPFAGDAEKARLGVLEKPWGPGRAEALNYTPSLLMIDRDFDEFDPCKHRWVVFRLGEDARELRSLLTELTKAVTDQDSDPFSILKAAIDRLALAEAGKAFNLRPGIFGLSIDLRTAWDALGKYLKGRSARG